MRHHSLAPPPEPRSPDRIVVIGGSELALELLRLATIRSDEIVLIGHALSEPIRCFANRFVIEIRERAVSEFDIVEASSLLVAIGEVEAENHIVRIARRHGIPIFVGGRSLVSDFRMIDFLEQRPFTSMAA